MSESVNNLSGAFLLAHPQLQDPNFRRAVVFLSLHNDHDGALGVVVNRPLGRKLADVDSAFTYSPLGDLPVYAGGPVKEDQLILAAWQWSEDPSGFRLYFGIDEEQATEMKELENATVRAFLGYSGWGEGQLEAELLQKAWIVSDLEGDILSHFDGPDLWKKVLRGISPEMKLLADFPDDPSRN